MIDSKHLLKVSAAWISIVYIVCYAGVAFFPGLRDDFMKYALHTENAPGQNFLTIGSFFAGLIIWNVITVLGIWIFAYLFNKIKK